MEKLLHTIAPQLAVAGAYSFIGEIKGVVFELRWMLVFIVVMIIADFVLGIIDSVVKRGEDFRFSRAGRRTMLRSCSRLVYAAIPFRPCAALGWPSCLSSTLSWSISALSTVSRTK